MDLEKLSADAIEKVFALLPTAVALGTYYKNVSGQASGDYNPDEDTTPAPASRLNVRMMRVAASEEELVGTSVTVNDVKIIIPAKDLGTLTPGTEDYLDYPGVRYDVIKVKTLPVKTIRILYCRAK